MVEEDSSTSWRAAQEDLEMMSRASRGTVLGLTSSEFVTMHPKTLYGGYLRLSGKQRNVYIGVPTLPLRTRQDFEKPLTKNIRSGTLLDLLRSRRRDEVAT